MQIKACHVACKLVLSPLTMHLLPSQGFFYAPLCWFRLGAALETGRRHRWHCEHV